MRPRVTDAVSVVGSVTLAAGGVLTVAPGRAGAALGLGERTRFVRALGIADLVLAPALLDRRRRRTLPMMLRAGLNGVIAAGYLEQTRCPGAPARARVGAIAMTVLVVVDGALAWALSRAETASSDPMTT